MTKRVASYRAAIEWMVANDDTEWLADGAPALSVTRPLPPTYSAEPTKRLSPICGAPSGKPRAPGPPLTPRPAARSIPRCSPCARHANRRKPARARRPPHAAPPSRLQQRPRAPAPGAAGHAGDALARSGRTAGDFDADSFIRGWLDQERHEMMLPEIKAMRADRQVGVGRTMRLRIIDEATGGTLG